MKQPIVSAFVVTLLLAATAPANAQETSTASPEGENVQGQDSQEESADGQTLSDVVPAEGFSNDTIDDEKIDSFIQAVSMIGQVSAHYNKLVEEAENDDRRAFLVETANKDIVKAINAAPNITPSEFVAIDQASQNDKELSDRILGRMAEIRAENRPKERLRFSEPAAEPAE